MALDSRDERAGGLADRARLRLRALVRRGAVERELDEEVRFHLEREAEALVRQGVAPARARREALRRFGGVERYKEEARDARGTGLADELAQDVRYALRAFRHAPAFALVVVATLALGIGASTAVFTAVRGVLLRELPFADPDRLVVAWNTSRARDFARVPVSLPDFRDWAARSRSFERMAAYTRMGTGLVHAEGGEPAQLATAFVTEDFFATLGVQARLGRALLPAEHADGANRFVVLSDALWRSRFAADPAIVGRSVRLSDEPFTVVGVLPPGFRYPDGDTDVWTPLTVIPASGIPRLRGVKYLQVVGRMKPGVTAERARADLATVVRGLEAEHRESNRGWSVALRPLREEIVGGSQMGLLIAFGAVLLVLALACVNVATLFLARASTRERELAVRLALGAGRARLVRQLLTESVLLAALGGALGVALAWWGSAALASLGASFLPRGADLRPDWMVLAFGALVSVATGLAFGVAPATRAPGALAGTLRASGRGATAGRSTQRLRTVFVCAQVALAVLLVAGAGLLAKSWARLMRTDLGFDAEHTLVARFTMPQSRYVRSADYLAAASRILEQVRATPGVTAAALIKNAPMRGWGEPYSYRVPGRDETYDQLPRAGFQPVSPDYFRTMGIPLVEGRDFTARDGDTLAPTAIITESLARRLWPGRSAVGEAIASAGRELRVVGVVGDARYLSLDSTARPTVYLPQRLMTRSVFSLVVRSPSPDAALPAVREAIREVDPQLALVELAPMREVVASTVSAPRFLVALIALFGALALVLAAVGIYGVVAYVVGWRAREIGIRVALGAESGRVVRWALWSGLAPVLAGLAVGVAAALASSRVLASALYETSPTDPGVFAGVVAALAAVAVVAAGIPALRAARVDPIIALRQD